MDMTVSQLENLRLRFGFAFASMSHATGQNLIMVLAFRHLTDNMGIAAATAGLLFFIVKIYDGFSDPLIGAFSDRTRSKMGRRLPYLLFGSVFMPVAVVLFFASPFTESSVLLLPFLALVMMLHATTYTAMTIPGIAMVAEVTDDTHERSTLMSFRVIGNTAGMLAGSSIPAWLLVHWGSDSAGHLKVAYLVAAIVLVSGLLSVWFLRSAAEKEVFVPQPRLAMNKIWQQLRYAWNNLPYRTLAIAHIFVLIGTATTGVSNAHFTRYILQASDGWLGTYYLIATIGVVASIPLWLRVAKKTGKKSCYLTAMALFGVCHLSWWFVDSSTAYFWLVFRALVTGVGSAGLILFAYSMLSDAIRYDGIRTGLRQEGSYAGLTSLLDKVSAAGGIWGLGILMSAAGYISATDAKATQPDSAIAAIYFGFALVPAICMALSFVSLLRYNLTDADLVIEENTEPTLPISQKENPQQQKAEGDTLGEKTQEAKNEKPKEI